MAEIKKFEPFILKWEGGAKYTNKKSDKGGATKYGITIATWRTVGYDKNGDGKIDEKDVSLSPKMISRRCSNATSGTNGRLTKLKIKR